MRRSELPPATLEGWYMLHQLYRLDWPGLKRVSKEEVGGIGEEFAALLQTWEEIQGGGWSASFRMAGGGVDFMLLHLRPSLESLMSAERAVQMSAMGDHLWLAHDYVSVVELGLYALSAAVAARFEEAGEDPEPEAWAAALAEEAESQRGLSFVQQRLRPAQPAEMPYVCFYPMDKRRTGSENWYTVPLRERSRMMHEHGTVGRRFADRISQVISGSIGLDDWEWAVTLFGRDPLDFKAVVTEMRYDLASALYAEFGAFYVGKRMRSEEWRRRELW